MKRNGIAVLACILAISMSGGVFGAVSINGGGGSNSGHTRRSGGGGGGGSYRGVRKGVSGNTQGNTSGQSSATNTQTTSTALKLVAELEQHAILPSVGTELIGLPEKTVESINSINQGGDVSNAIGLKEFAAYKAMDKTMAIVTTDADGKVADLPTKVRIYVPNLVEGLGDVRVVAYANSTGRWTDIKILGIDYKAKTIDIMINGSSTVCVIYK